MSFFRQLGALLRKDILVRKFKRHYIKAALEYLLPILIWGIYIHIWIRATEHSGSDTPGAAKVYLSMGPYNKTRFEKPRTGQTDVYYAPDNDYTSNVTRSIFGNPNYNVRGCASETDMKIAMNNDTRDRTLLGLLFSSKAKADSIEYEMRWRDSIEMNVDHIFTENSRPRNIYGPTAGEESYLWPLMYSIFNEHLRYFGLGNVEMPSLQPLPTQKYTEDLATDYLKFVFLAMDALVFTTFVMFLTSYTKNIMQDKETRLRELLRMMGLSDSVYWTNAFLVGFLNAVLLCALVTISLCVNFGSVASLPKSDASLIFLIVSAYAIGIILMALLISVLIKPAKVGSIVVVLAQGSALFLMQHLDPLAASVIEYTAQPKMIKLLTSMIPPCGFHWAMKLVVFLEQREVGAKWSNLFERAIEGDNVTLGSVLGTMIYSWALWILVILYLDAVVPWQFGMPKHPLFFLRYSYWNPKGIAPDRVKLNEDCDDDSIADDMVEQSNFSEMVIKLHQITHQFGALRAVDNLSLELYGNQITVLLGHNGAGKTTTMNILTGLFPPTRGEIYINGHSVRSDTKRAREGVGLCPQHNVLFDDLTVEEHLHFFSRLKSSTSSPSEVKDLMEKLELTSKAKTLSKSLSGGMKRKLSLANAMVGGSSILILDEPSSGLDPEARRLVWDLLQQERTKRTVLMTTHYMEEADVLGDRIAFIAKGKLICAGSPMFLKRKFETGYKLRLTKVYQNTDPETVVACIRSQIPESSTGIHLVSDMSYEFVVNIGFPDSAQMITLFRYLEDNKENLGIESMGASVTTMEDVFLKVGQREEDLAPNVKEETSLTLFESFPEFTRLTGTSLILRQSLALIAMRFQSWRRDEKIIAYMMLLPLLFSLLYMITIIPKEDTIQTKTVNYSIASLLGKSKGFLGGSDSDSIADAFAAQLLKDGVGVSLLSNLSSTEEVNDYFLKQAETDLNTFKYHTSAGVVKGINSIFFNGQPYHVGAAALADWQASRLAEITGGSSSVKISNHPLEPTSYTPPITQITNTMRTMGVIFLGIVFSYASGALIVTPVQERVRKSKLIQTMSGVRPIVYIGSNFAFDATVVFISLVLCLVVMLCFNPANGFTTFGETIPALLLIFMMFVFATVPWTYILSYLFTSSTTAFSVYISLSSLIVLLGGLIFSVIETLLQLVEDRADLYLQLLSFVPVFSGLWSFITTHRNGCVKTVFDQEGVAAVCSGAGAKYFAVFCIPCPGEDTKNKFCYQQHSVFNMDLYTGIGFQLLAMLLTGVVGFALLMLIESNTRRVGLIVDSIKSLFSWRKASVKGTKRHLYSGDGSFIRLTPLDQWRRHYRYGIQISESESSRL